MSNTKQTTDAAGKIAKMEAQVEKAYKNYKALDSVEINSRRAAVKLSAARRAWVTKKMALEQMRAAL